MNKYRIDDYLKHIFDAAKKVRIFVCGLDEKTFLEDVRTQEAVLWNFVVIGEAATKIMKNHKEFVATHPEIAWHDMRGLRNSAVHEYVGIDYEIIWLATQVSIPKLIKNLENILDHKK